MGEQFKWNPSAERVGQMLRQAVYMEDVVTLEHLLKQRADLEARDESGATPLHIAATQCKPGMVGWLLKQRSDLQARDGEGFSALTWACVKGHGPIIAMLLGAAADINEVTDSSGKTPLAISAERGNFDSVLELLSRRASVECANRDGSTALMCAAHQSETQVVAYLLERQSLVNAVDAGGWTALMYAVNAPVPPAAAGGEAAEKKVGIDGVMGKRSTTELMLLHGADLNAQTADGLTPLIIAAGRDRPLSVKRLLEGRAQVNMATAKGQSALLMAAAHDFPQVCKALILAQAEVNHANERKDTPLSLAEKYGHKEVLELLRKAGAAEPKGKKAKGKKGK
uniref:Uncharacterized protein n=1 Tax=Zooxanthella nutricula TaxID=1333877 RepID=A0A6U9IY81_9DINO|mmetsp:Transcript_104383/g.319617  ORF Transcript_104383/g.319617 Transcript_104383/m.319617 type:complete len:340 (+) Transcript_104383:30-1049(+)